MCGCSDDGAFGGVIDLYLFEMLEFQGRNDWHLFLHDFIIVLYHMYDESRGKDVV